MDSSLEQACDTWILASKTVGLLTYRNIRQQINVLSHHIWFR